MSQESRYYLANIRLRKELGRAYLRSDKIEEALEVYADILENFPEDIESYVVIGDYLLAEGRPDLALHLYRQALKINPEEPNVVNRVNLAKTEREFSENHGETTPEKSLETPTEIIRFLRERVGYSKRITDEELARATRLLNTVLNSPHPAKVVSDHLQEIDSLLPALIDMNIRQARTEGRNDLVSSLKQVLNALPTEDRKSAKNLQKEAHLNRRGKVRNISRILLLHQEQISLTHRLMLLSQAMSTNGIQVDISPSKVPIGNEGYDAIIAQAPMTNLEDLEDLATWSAKGIPIIVNLEADYEQMPVTHPHYEVLGLDTLNKAKSYTTLLLLADAICVPSSSLGATLLSVGYPVRVIPEGWDRQNEMWHKPSAKRHTLHLGWMRDPGQLEDIAMIRRVLLRLIREFPHVCLLILEDSQVYQLFEKVPDPQKLFLPLVNFEDYPYLLSQMDVLLIPSRNTPYNRSCSDKRYVEAGVRRIPWISSPIPSAISWGVGGLIADTLDEWYMHLRQLILDHDLRNALGLNGRERAEEREIMKIVPEWIDLISSCIAQKKNGHHKRECE